MSYQLDLSRQDLLLTTLTGAWAREFEPDTAPVRRGRTVFGSVSGTSGHYCNSFFALSDPNTGEHSGEIYGFIDTGTLTSELMVSVSASLAQEESISISKNQRMSYQRRMERGEFITCKAPFGYRLVNGKEMEIIPEKAHYVKWIFHTYLNGASMEWIAEQMTKTGLLTSDGGHRWYISTIAYLLTNEKYMGDALCQKTFASTFPFTRQMNCGERDQYYVDHSHPAIISKEIFEKAQALLQRKGQRIDLQRERTPLSKKMTCGLCGSTLVRRISKAGYVSWACRKNDRKAADCPNGRISEDSIHTAFLRMYHKLRTHDGIVLSPILKQMDALSDPEDTSLRPASHAGPGL